jgi:hypothetical protein
VRAVADSIAPAEEATICSVLLILLDALRASGNGRPFMIKIAQFSSLRRQILYEGVPIRGSYCVTLM